jgi:uroporphyrinogen decarboxylase
MSEYRLLREKYGMLEMIQTPELAAQVTLQPIQAFDLDAAIIFADILPPLIGMGLELEFVEGKGPMIHNPISSPGDIDSLAAPPAAETLAGTLKAVEMVAAELAPRDIPLIGFAGAPFTLASYAIEGGHSNNFALTKALMYGSPPAWHRLCDKLATVAADYLRAQIEAGVDAVQVFDSWVGALNADDYREFVRPHTRRLFEAVGGLVPAIHFGTGTGSILAEMREAGGDVIGADWRIRLEEAWKQIGPDRAVQGNLDPTLLLGPRARLIRGAADVLAQAAGRPGHIFNLGHGILPMTPLENVQALARFVHEESAAEAN